MMDAAARTRLRELVGKTADMATSMGKDERVLAVVEIIVAVPELLDEIERLQEPACQFAGPGRGDCEHFVGLNDDRDHYGKPAGWCVWCWQLHRLRYAEARAERAEAALQAWLDLGSGCTCKPESGCAAAIVREQARAVLAEVPR